MAQRIRDSRGFTLIEVMVVVLIIGILAAIAIPAFLTQRSRAQDADAKSAVRTARQTLETYNTDRSTYDTDAATLIDMEPALREASNLTVTGAEKTFRITVDSRATSGGGTFSMELDGTGNVTRECSNPGRGGCRATADAAGNRW